MWEMPDRRLLIIMAVLGLLLYAVRLETTFAPEPRDPPSPHAALADDMELYQMSLMTGSAYSATAFEDVERACRQEANDADVARACRMFDDAVHHASDHSEIDAAAAILRDG